MKGSLRVSRKWPNEKRACRKFISMFRKVRREMILSEDTRKENKRHDTKLNDHSFPVNVRAEDETVMTILVKKCLVFESKAIAMPLPKYCAS